MLQLVPNALVMGLQRLQLCMPSRLILIVLPFDCGGCATIPRGFRRGFPASSMASEKYRVVGVWVFGRCSLPVQHLQPLKGPPCDAHHITRTVAPGCHCTACATGM